MQSTFKIELTQQHQDRPYSSTFFQRMLGAISDEEDTSVAKPLFSTSKWAKAGAASKAAVRLRVS